MREAAVAGKFYPGDAAQLTATMDIMLAAVKPTIIDGTVLAAVAPHAGYAYSGPVAAYTYAALKGHTCKRVVLITPSHFESFGFTSVYAGDAYATPLGLVPVDKDFARKLAKMDPSIQLSDKGHKPTAAGGEHALEVQLPWLQHILGSFELVPVVMGDQSYQSSRALGVALAKLIAEEQPQGPPGETLVLASSDLSHYHPYYEAVGIDHKTLAALESWDYYSMSRNFESHIWEACGGAPIVATMIYAERMGANRSLVLRYANSGDTSGDAARVVGYSAALFVKSPATVGDDAPFSLHSDDKKELLSIARRTVESVVGERQQFNPEPSKSETLNHEYGAFVTLTKYGQLRGCIGYTAAMKPLYLTVRDTATLAALRDPRFPPVAPGELPELEYEISVLSPLRRVTDLTQIEVGRHGLLMKNGSHEGLLLPQVPGAFGWDRKTFLEQTCAKAGLPHNCWQSDDTDIFRFTADVFHEEKLEVGK
ncbi:AmmeMemoRadiSam system protein B [Telmatobacter bradus]|uniref:AmmeMemoRadiSam system protein B n=1 Tax=Telmatobacter bradus TaxID=474953 RepID=UPI003B428AE7